MTLKSLTPNNRISLTELQQAFSGKSWQSIIPSGLSDELLIKLAYEFRSLERYMLSDEAGEPPSLTVPTYVVAAFLAARRPQGSSKRQVQFSELGLELAIRAYLREMERVIVDRITGPDGHPKLLHCWPVKLLQAGRGDYAGSGVMASRAAASLSR